jgi:hypothetical protein
MLLCRREKVSQTYLDRSADHTEALNSAKLRVLDLNRLALSVPTNHSTGASNDDLHSYFKVRAAANDVLDLSLSDINAANAKLVGIGMGVDLLDLAYDDLLKSLGEIFSSLDLNG